MERLWRSISTPGARRLSVGLTAVVLLGCGGETFESHWRGGDITIDGATADWTDALVAIEDDRFRVGVRNDGDHLYVCLVAQDREDQVRIMGAGLTVWFDPQGGEERTLGIRFPLGHREERPPEGMTEPPERGLSELWDYLATANEMEVLLNDGVATERLPIVSVKGLSVASGEEDDTLVYEAMIPLTRGDGYRYAIGVSQGTIGVGLETPEMERPSGPPPGMGRGGDDRGGRPPGGGGGRGMGGGRGGRGMPEEMSEPLEVWGKIRLAKPRDVAADVSP